MNCYGAKDLAAAFQTVRKNTITIAEEIGEEHYGFRATPDTRTVAQTLIHIALVPRMQHQVHGVERRATLEGFDFMGFFGPMMAEEQAGHGKAHIVKMLRETGDQFTTWMESLSDETLAEHVKMPPGMQPASKTRFEMLLGVKEHEMHHRAQLMLLERMVGIVPHLTRQMEARFAAMQAQQRAHAS